MREAYVGLALGVTLSVGVTPVVGTGVGVAVMGLTEILLYAAFESTLSRHLTTEWDLKAPSRLLRSSPA